MSRQDVDVASRETAPPRQSGGKAWSISTRVAASVTAAAIVVSGATILVTSRKALGELDATLARKADDALQYLVGALEVPLWSVDSSTVLATCNAFAQNELVVRLTVRDEDGMPVCVVDKGPDPTTLRRAAVLHHKQASVGEVELLVSRRPALEAQRRLLYDSAVALLAVSVSLVLLTNLLVRLFLRKPIDALDRMVRPFAAGRYDAPVHDLPYVEFRSFARTLAAMGTTIRRQMQEVTEAEAKYRGIFENAQEGLFQTTPDGRYLSVNPALARLHGYRSPAELLASVTDLERQNYVRPADRARFREMIEQRGSVERFETEQYRRDGSTIWVSVNARVVRGPSGEVLFYEGSIEDVTERRRAQDRARELAQELERRVVQRTAELEAANREMEGFVYSVSHDLRAPLRHLDGFVELLRRKVAGLGDEQAQRCMETIGASARRMGELIDDLLSFARMARADLSRQQVDLSALAGDVVAECGARDGKNVEWSIGPLPRVTADRAMLRVVLVNLVSNALKFTRPREQPRIEIGAERRGDGEVAVFVRDNGVGFDPAYAGKLFGVFQRLHRAEEFDGTGIGLATVRRIIARQGGRTWAEGSVGAGATFWFSLPEAT